VNPRVRLGEIETELRSINDAAGDATLTEEQQSRWDALEEERGTVQTAITRDEKRRATLAAMATEQVDSGTAVTGDGAENRARPAGGATVTAAPQIYGRGSGHSYFLDLARVQLNQGDADGGVEAARSRLSRHAEELRTDLPKREAARARRAETEMRGMPDGTVFERPMESRVNPNRTDGQGGFFVPPLWMVDQYIDLPRFGRTTANLCAHFDLPPGTDSINMPKVATGTVAAVQTADAAAVSSVDLTDTSVSAAVKTIAGQQDIALQLLDQSPINFDDVIYGDLIMDLNRALDVQVINGSGAAGQVTGILNVASINAVTYTDASPTLPEIYVPLVQSASLIEKNRKLPGTAVVMIPSMWYWATGQLDTTNRPLIVQNAPAYNPAAVQSGLASEGSAGTFAYGMPAFTDGNIPSNLGGGTNETRVISARWSDLYLWEGPVRTRVLQEVLSGTLQVRIQVFEYFAFMGNRRPEAISVISGTGVIPTAGY
jgi:HK97 family phage major capsid protein